jgi:hypothetical protein
MRLDGSEISYESCPIQKNGMGIAQKSISLVLAVPNLYNDLKIILRSFLNTLVIGDRDIGFFYHSPSLLYSESEIYEVYLIFTSSSMMKEKVL